MYTVQCILYNVQYRHELCQNIKKRTYKYLDGTITMQLAM